MPRERVAALGIGALAVVAGGFSLLLVGAPVGLAVRNLIAFAAGIGLGCLGQFLQPRETAFWPRFVLTCLMLSLVLIVGTTIGGVSRWLDFGLFTLQPGLILLPTLLTTLSQDHTGWRRAALLLAVILIAFQPDAATLTALAACDDGDASRQCQTACLGHCPYRGRLFARSVAHASQSRSGRLCRRHRRNWPFNMALSPSRFTRRQWC